MPKRLSSRERLEQLAADLAPVLRGSSELMTGWNQEAVSVGRGSGIDPRHADIVRNA